MLLPLLADTATDAHFATAVAAAAATTLLPPLYLLVLLLADTATDAHVATAVAALLLPFCCRRCIC